MAKSILNQIVIGATIGDAITDQALLLRKWLRDMGFQSDIYAESIHPKLIDDIKPVNLYRPHKDELHIIYHHSIGTSLVDLLLEFSRKLIVIYHNVTPPEFFSSIDPALAQQMNDGRRQLKVLLPHTVLALADSKFNLQDLQMEGFSPADVLPIVLDQTLYSQPSNPKLMEAYKNNGPILLFVGRIVPNKKQEDLIKLLYYYRRIEPSARLILVGSPWLPAYEQWLRDLAIDLGIADGVVFTEHVSQQDMVTYYRLADVYISMSEHEGFGKPLVESMYLGLPVLAYSVAAVPDTMGQAGVRFHHKNYEALAELVDLMIYDTSFREQIIIRQRQEVRRFLEPYVKKKWIVHLTRVTKINKDIKQ